MKPEERLGSLLASRSQTLAAAESCTGGLFSSSTTDIPGSSLYFLGGIIAYSNSSKIEVLGVTADIIQKHGAVSDRAALAMASRVMDHFVADIGLGITGIAGPTGGSEEKPVGTVFIAVASEDSEVVREFHFEGDRQEVRRQTVQAALGLACEFLESQE